MHAHGGEGALAPSCCALQGHARPNQGELYLFDFFSRLAAGVGLFAHLRGKLRFSPTCGRSKPKRVYIKKREEQDDKEEKWGDFCENFGLLQEKKENNQRVNAQDGNAQDRNGGHSGKNRRAGWEGWTFRENLR